MICKTTYKNHYSAVPDKGVVKKHKSREIFIVTLSNGIFRRAYTLWETVSSPQCNEESGGNEYDGTAENTG